MTTGCSDGARAAAGPDDLAPRQREVLDLVRRLTAERGIPPTVRELMGPLGIRSPNGVVVHLKALEGKGWLRRDPKAARGLYLTEKAGGAAASEPSDLERRAAAAEARAGELRGLLRACVPLLESSANPAAPDLLAKARAAFAGGAA